MLLPPPRPLFAGGDFFCVRDSRGESTFAPFWGDGDTPRIARPQPLFRAAGTPKKNYRLMSFTRSKRALDFSGEMGRVALFLSTT